MLGLALVALPAAAQAADPATATISACGGDSLTVAGKVALSRSAARRARGATLQLRFQALALFGLPHSGEWKSVGKKTKAATQEAFPGLAADSWVGVMSWRFKRGSRTVLSGLARSQALRIGRSKGRAGCTIAEGLKPVDKTPPSLFIIPANEAGWYHAPVSVQLTASDDFSGVKSMSYGVDGAAKQPIANGSAFPLSAQGPHTVDWQATDAAGNTGSRSAVVRVDGGAPTKPAFSSPFSVTKSTTPTFSWSASTDSGSGMRGYVLIVKKASDGSIVVFQSVGANTTSVGSPVALTDGETYTATVTAVDNTADTPWTTESDPLTFRVDSTPDVSSPQDGQVLAFDAKSHSVFVNFDRPIDTSTMSGITLTRDSGSSTPWTGPTCASPCSSVSFAPDSNFPEGRYTLTVDVKSEEGVPMQKTFHFAVPASTNETASSSTTSTCAADPLPNPSNTYTVTTQAGSETVLASYVPSVPAGTVGRVRVLESGTPRVTSGAIGSGDNGVRSTLSFTLTGASPHTLSFEYCRTSGSGAFGLNDIYVSRAP